MTVFHRRQHLGKDYFMEHVLDVKKLVNELTLEEKASLCSGADFWHTEAIDRLNIPAAMVSDGPQKDYTLYRYPSSASRKILPIIWALLKVLKPLVFRLHQLWHALLTATCCIKSATLLVKNVSLKILPYYWAQALI